MNCTLSILHEGYLRLESQQRHTRRGNIYSRESWQLNLSIITSPAHTKIYSEIVFMMVQKSEPVGEDYCNKVCNQQKQPRGFLIAEKVS